MLETSLRKRLEVLRRPVEFSSIQRVVQPVYGSENKNICGIRMA